LARVIVFALIAALLAIPGVGEPVQAAKPRCDGLKATIVGSDKSQTMFGTKRDDVIVAKGGVDRIFGEGGDDIICAGPGNDVVDGGAGRDRIFGAYGNDELKGGRGKDVLDGGDGEDACYPAAGGDRVRRCEEADLKVTIVSPTSVPASAPIVFNVIVQNVGVKRAGASTLSILQTATGVVCGLDHTGTTSIESLWPGGKDGHESGDAFRIEAGCSLGVGSDQHLDITATATSANPDDDPTNDSATARVVITSPGSVPTPTPTPISL
jgi:hypothetical protein